jgi:hypothetical protein
MDDENAKMAKLPKWAQYRFAQLQADLKHAQDMLELEQGKYPNTNTFLDSRTRGLHPLPDNSMISFHLGEERELRVKIDRFGKLRIMALGQGSLAVFPEVSNVIAIGLLDD